MSPSRSAIRRGPRFWLATVGAVAGITATGLLGRWQLDRAAQREALHAAIVQRGELPPLDTAAFVRATASPAEAEAQVHRRARLRGRWLADHTVYLDNRQMQGRPGFFVVTPLQPAAGGPAVLVQRGWVPRDFLDRSRIAPVATPAGTVEIDGRIAPPPARLFDFDDGRRQAVAGAEGFSRIRQNLELGAFGAEIHVRLAPVSLVQTGAPGEGLLRDWTEPGSGVEKHYGYAFQWFGLCGLIAFLYVWFHIVRRFWPARARPGP
ncbi:SURF1 family protein [Xylophilus sp.]|uniref:SURF1 family protein n=1 Tax=Xylophilus sp. TaxID=2653893 RepID=UPI0013B845D1|nr:SURF1 family protein [Xylophilus sp.]KAF1048524.1 MAG: hypothetical protein GAK38_01274 [Xylophilus sp.]